MKGIWDVEDAPNNLKQHECDAIDETNATSQGKSASENVEEDDFKSTDSEHSPSERTSVEIARSAQAKIPAFRVR